LAESTLRRAAAAFDTHGMISLIRPTKAQREDHHRSLPVPMRQLIVDLKAEYPDFTLGEIASICAIQFQGRRPSKHTVKAVLADGPRPSRTTRQFPRYEEIADPEERRLAVIHLHAQGWSVSTIAGYLDLFRHIPHTRSLLQGIELGNKVRNRCIQVPFVDRSEESSKERNPPSFNSHQKGELCLLTRYRCEDMIVKNGEPQQRANPLPMVKRAKFSHLEPCGQAIAQVQHSLRLGDRFSRWSQFNGFDMFRPAWPCLDTSEVMPGGFERDINHKRARDQRWHSLFPLLSALRSASRLPLLS
jgi:hypothetical protein